MVTPCSKLWTDINLNIHRKEVVNCCKRSQAHTPTIEEISNPDFWTNRKELVDARRYWAKKSNFPKLFGNFFKQVVEDILKGFKKTEIEGTSEVTYPTAFKIGLFQCLAMVPGVSRSAATIIGGLTQKMNRQAAAEFSFFLAIPTMFAATGYKLLKFFQEGNGFETEEIQLLLIGNVVGFIVAIIAIKGFIAFLTNHGFKLFGYYRIIVGLLILILHFSGVEITLY